MATAPSREIPSRSQALAFFGKTACFRGKRLLTNFLGGRAPRYPKEERWAESSVLAESRSLLYPSQNPSELALQAGKVQNLRVAARFLDRVVIPAGKTFRFWAYVPRPSSRHGFVDGRELREGCIVPSIGGGLCQLSNALYDVALRADLEIVERHAHSRVLPGSMAAAGRDATVFWNYVDLQFRADQDMQMEVLLGRGELVVRIRGKHSPPEKRNHTHPEVGIEAPAGDPVESCETCDVTECFRHPGAPPAEEGRTTAWLVDAFWPEHDQYLQDRRGPKDHLFLPLDHSRYPWAKEGFSNIETAPVTTLKRSWRSRRLAAQGAERQRALLAMDEALAASYARRIPLHATHLVVSQNLLPFLWREGHLGGRTFEVLMTRFPLRHLQSILDDLAQRWPESHTAGDFRCDPVLSQPEAEALQAAERWVTPHSAIAALAPEQAELLDWQLPDSKSGANPGKAILFPASTLARKGAYELRACELDCLQVAGPPLEGEDFWPHAKRVSFDLGGVGLVALPAWVEHQPRRLLEAVAEGIPVVASENCGLSQLEGVSEVPLGDIEALAEAISKHRPTRERDSLSSSSS